jgi:hypothetical protein
MRNFCNEYHVLMTIHVECYSGYRGETEPRAFLLGERRLAVVEVIDRWLSLDHGTSR